MIQNINDSRLADFAFVTTAAPEAVSMSMKLLAPMGSLVLVGMPEDGIVSEFDPGLIAARNQQILGSKMGTSRPHFDIPSMVKLWTEGKLNLEKMISNVYELDDINKAIKDMRSGSTIRAVVCPSSTKKDPK